MIGVAAALVVAAADWAAVARDARRVEAALKPLVPAILAVTAVALHAGWFAAALALCLVGDVFLLPQIDRFRSGLAAFLLGHLAFVAGFVGFAVFRPGLGLLPVLAVLMIFPATRVLLAAPKSLRLPIALYVLVIATMLEVAFSRGEGFLEAGALLFVISDGLLAWNRFVRPIPRARLAVMGTYHLAIGLLTVSLVT